MGKYKKAARFLAAMLVIGGIAGIAIVTISGVQIAEQNWLLAILMIMPASLFAWAVFTGARLWQGTAYGRKWAPILFFSQIPVAITPGFAYHWFTGLHFGPTLQFSGGDFLMGFGVNVGAHAKFSVGADATEFILGFNLFAVIALVLLLRSNKSFVRTARVGPISEA